MFRALGLLGLLGLFTVLGSRVLQFSGFSVDLGASCSRGSALRDSGT